MFELLENLRQKPVNVRKRIAFIAAFVCAAGIFTVWLTVIYPDFTHSQSIQEKAEASAPSPWDSFTSTLSGGFSAIGGQFNELKSTVSSLGSSSAHYTATTTTY